MDKWYSVTVTYGDGVKNKAKFTNSFDLFDFLHKVYGNPEVSMVISRKGNNSVTAKRVKGNWVIW